MRQLLLMPFKRYQDGGLQHRSERWVGPSVIHGCGRASTRFPVLDSAIPVMNTDNMSIAGETIDYGPCAFMDAYNPRAVYSSIDQMGRYAYGNQPNIAQWNLIRLAETLLPLLAEDHDAAVAHAEDSLGAFVAIFWAAYLDGLRRKLGLAADREGDTALAQDLLTLMAEN